MKSELEDKFQAWLKSYHPWGHYWSGDTIATYREIFYAGAKAQEECAEVLAEKIMTAHKVEID